MKLPQSRRSRDSPLIEGGRAGGREQGGNIIPLEPILHEAEVERALGGMGAWTRPTGAQDPNRQVRRCHRGAMTEGVILGVAQPGRRE